MCLLLHSSVYIYTRGRGHLQKNWVGVCGPLPKTIISFWSKYAIFPSPFSTWPKIRYHFSDHSGWHSCPKHNLWRAFLDRPIDNKEKVTSFEKRAQSKTRVQIPYPIYDQNGQNGYPIYEENGLELISFEVAHTYIAQIRVYPPPPHPHSRVCAWN